MWEYVHNAKQVSSIEVCPPAVHGHSHTVKNQSYVYVKFLTGNGCSCKLMKLYFVVNLILNYDVYKSTV